MQNIAKFFVPIKKGGGKENSMTNAELKENLLKTGVKAEDIAKIEGKVDAEAMELTEDELEHVAGGTGSSSINWKAILIGVACALVCVGVAAGLSAAFAPVGAKIANAVVWGRTRWYCRWVFRGNRCR